MAIESDASFLSRRRGATAQSSTAALSQGQALPVGSQLREYQIRGVIDESEIGFVYRGWDASLQREVAIKEYLPRVLAERVPGSAEVTLRAGADAAVFAAGLKGFIAEARVLAHISHPALVKVYRFWQAHGSAYRVMPLYEGQSLERLLSEHKAPTEAEIRTWLRPLLDAVSAMHAARSYHHHIGADKILMTPAGPVLLDFAAARRLVGSLLQGPASVAKAGYAPIEQYSNAATLAPGPWTDLYSLAAVVYRAITGQPPPPAPQRVEKDTWVPLSHLAADRYAAGFVRAIDSALAVQPESRPRDDAEFRALMGGIEAPPPQPAFTPPDLMAEPFAAAGEITIPLQTQPGPTPIATAADLMAEPFLTSTTAATADETARLSQRAKVTLLLGMGLLGALGAAVLSLYAGDDIKPVPASEVPGVVSSKAPATATNHASLLTGASTAPASAEAAATAAAPPAPSAISSTRSAPTTAAGAEAPPPTPAQLRAAPAAVAPTTPAAIADSARHVPVGRHPTNEKERKAWCGELLQEATLRSLSEAEAAFFKKECR